MIWPVMNDARSEAANRMASAISSGLPARLSGTPATRPAFLSALPVMRSSIAVSIGPGATALTRTPNAAPSSAADLVKPRSEEHTSELQSRQYLVCRLLLEKKKHSLPQP